MFRLLRGIGLSWKLRSVDVQADVGNFVVGLGFLQQSYICTSGQECKIGMIDEGPSWPPSTSFHSAFSSTLCWSTCWSPSSEVAMISLTTSRKVFESRCPATYHHRPTRTVQDSLPRKFSGLRNDR